MNKIDNLRYWCYKVLPLVYDDSLSYYEVVCKVANKLNELVDKVNNLPSYIEETIKEYISSGDLENVVRTVLADFIVNVKYPPNNIIGASGDGSREDTDAIQGCIDYVASKGGGAVYFPSGKYLTNSLNLSDNVCLFGFDRYSTELILTGGATNGLLNLNDVNGASIRQLKLNGNSGVQVNNVNTFNAINSANCEINDVIFDNCYRAVYWDNGSGHFDIANVQVEDCSVNCFTINGNSDVFVSHVVFNALNVNLGENILNISSNNGVYDFISKAVSNECVFVTGDNNTFRCYIENSVTPFTDSGVNNTFVISGVEYKISGKLNLSGELNIENISNIIYKKPTDLNEYFSYYPFTYYVNNTQYIARVLVEKNDFYSYVSDKFDEIDLKIELATTNKVDNYTTKYRAIGYVNNGRENESLQDCFVVKLKDKCMLIDTGYIGDTSLIASAISHFGHNKIDIIYISHYHEDHAENFENIANAIDITNAVVYCPSEPSSVYDSQRVISCYNMVMRVCAANNCDVVHPSEGATFNLTDVESITFYNTIQNVYYSDDVYDYNNCSLCAAIKTYNTIAWFDGDVLKSAQEKLYSSVPADVMVKKMSHHGTTPDGDDRYFAKLNGSYIIATDGNGYSNDRVTNNVLSSWGYETTYLARLNVPTFATSNAPNYLLDFEVGDRFFKCENSRYIYSRINPVNTSTASIVKGYTSAVSNLTLEEIIDMMPESYLEFNAPASWACIPSDEFASGAFIRIWKNSSTNTQNSYAINDNIEFALCHITEHGYNGDASASIILMFAKSPSSDNKWTCAVMGGGSTVNFYATDGFTVAGNTKKELDILTSYLGNVFELQDGVLTCTTTACFCKVELYGSTSMAVNSEYDVAIVRVDTGGGDHNAARVHSKKSIDGEEYFSGVSTHTFYKGDKVAIKNNSSGNVWVKVNIVPMAFGWNYDQSAFLKP